MENYDEQTQLGQKPRPKYAVTVVTVLMWIACVLAMIAVYNRNNYDIDVQYKSEGWGENHTFVTISIKDKLIGNLCEAFDCDIFTTNVAESTSSASASEPETNFHRKPLLTRENVTAFAQRTYDHYRKLATIQALVCIALAVILFLVKRRINR